MQCVFNARFLFLHLDFGRSADFDHRNAAGELRDTLLQLFLVVVARRFLDLLADVLDARFDRRLFAGAVDDRGVFLADFDALGATQVFQRRVLELETQLFRDDRTAGQNRDVFEHRLATIAEARRLDGGGLQDAADVVDDERRERFTVNVFSDDQKLLAGLRHLLEDRQHVANVADLLVVQQDVRIFENRDLLFRVVDEVRRDVAAVELHAFDQLELVLEALAVFDGDDAFLADLLHRFGDRLADRLVRVGGDGADLRDFLAGRAGLADLLQLLDNRGDCLVDAALQVHRIHAGGDELQAFGHDRLSKHCRSRRAVAGDVGGLGSDFLDHLRTHVLELVLELDFLRDRHAVLGNRRRAEAALEDDVAALGTQGDPDGVRKNIDAVHHLVTDVFAEANVFGCHDWYLLMRYSVDASVDCLCHDADDVVFTHMQQFLAFDLEFLAGVFAEENSLPDLDPHRDHLAAVVGLSGACGDYFTHRGLFSGGIRNDDAAC